MFDFLEDLLMYSIYRLRQKYYKKKDPNADVCLVGYSPKDKIISFETSTTNGKITDFSIIRRSCGENKLFLEGPYSLSKIYLVVAPSCFRYRFLDTIKFVKDWHGTSTAEGRIVAIYKY